jgi:hypothetical protein
LQIIRTRFLQNRQTGTAPGSSLVWAMATIQWGSDVVRPQRAPVANVTP